MDFEKIVKDTGGERITVSGEKLVVPDNPVIPFIEGDGIGPDIWSAAQKVLDSAVEKIYGSTKKIAWTEILAGEKAYNKTGEWLPAETLETIQHFFVAIKGPLTTPVSGGNSQLECSDTSETRSVCLCSTGSLF